MKIQRWACGTCGFEWFEPMVWEKSNDHSIDHGCPQGCDDAGKVTATVEATNKGNTWICWMLSKENIDTIVLRSGLDKNGFTEEDYENIARVFIRGFEWANEDWADLPEDAIKYVMSA